MVQNRQLIVGFPCQKNLIQVENKSILFLESMIKTQDIAIKFIKPLHIPYFSEMIVSWPG
jgi:hypothetical protein